MTSFLPVLPARLLAGGALAAALVLAAGAQAGAADRADPTVKTKDGMRTLHVLGHETVSKFIPKGGVPTDKFPTDHPNPGDGFSFLEELRQDGALVGTDTGLCTVLEGAAHAARCEVTVTFPKGTMTVVGEGTDGQKESTYKLTGGTGAYEGVTGVVHVKDLSDTDSDITFVFQKAATETAASAFESAVAQPSVTTDGSTKVLHMVAAQTDTKFVPKGGEPSTNFPDRNGSGPKPGDAFAFTEDLTQDGTKVGTDKGGCTFAEPAAPLHCAVTLKLAKGGIDVEGDVVEGQANTLKLIGGTGAYEGIVGTVKVKDMDNDHTDLTLRYTTPGGGTQVSVVPAGGAATGGGSTADGVGRGLVGLGVLGAAVGAGLLGFGRRVGHRAR
jgi:hypothetical protein